MPISMKDFVERHPNLKIIIYAGKGGLGKTTCSAATAYWFSKNKKKALCFSTDPQASLSDIFERDIFGKGETKLAENLYVVEIDADKRVAEFHEEVRNKIKEMYKIDKLPDEIDRYISSTAYEPAMHESATYDAMADLLASKKYDIYIFDMPPFGHGVRMISMATILDAWIDKMTEARKKAAEYLEAEVRIRGSSTKVEDEILKELSSIREKLDFFRDALTNPETTGFFMVLIPEKMAILDTERAIKMFEKLGISLSGVIVNQVYPFELLEIPNLSEFLKHRIEMQKMYLKEIKEKFGEYVRAIIPMFDREPKGMEMIAKVADHLFENPSLNLLEMV
ncbi:arsenic transporter [Candidatus Geothermarchaeota archaeon]|nr:MAG: arsenic transporter [Candidatus Geothermarchaeota archaeon]RLG62625.1 MAG: arsenic transporter [Candidatus Geothermarchaeota archaeon]HEW94131.1 arsenic transporter [Thermoprotei archaeon]